MTRRATFALGLAAGASGLLAVTPAIAGDLRPAPESYQLHCSGCHGSEGRGVPGTTPSLRALGPLLAAEGGRSYLARVPGVAQAPVGDAELAALLNWVLVELSGAIPDPAYTAAEIARLRAEPLRDPGAARARLTTQ